MELKEGATEDRRPGEGTLGRVAVNGNGFPPGRIEKE